MLESPSALCRATIQIQMCNYLQTCKCCCANTTFKSLSPDLLWGFTIHNIWVKWTVIGPDETSSFNSIYWISSVVAVCSASVFQNRVAVTYQHKWHQHALTTVSDLKLSWSWQTLLSVTLQTYSQMVPLETVVHRNTWVFNFTLL